MMDPGNEKSWWESAELVTVFLQLFCFIRVFKIEYFTKAHINDNDDHHISIREYVLTARTAILLKTAEPSKLSPKLVINLKWKRIKKSEMQILLSKCNKTTRFFYKFLFWKLVARHSVNRFCQAFLSPELSKLWSDFHVLSFCCVDWFANCWNICWCQFDAVWKSTGLSNIEDGEKHEDDFGELHFVELMFGIKDCLDLWNWW